MTRKTKRPIPAPSSKRTPVPPRRDDSKPLLSDEQRIDDAIEGSFPASDPPPWTLGVARVDWRGE
jgi:hypothetical protein